METYHPIPASQPTLAFKTENSSCKQCTTSYHGRTRSSELVPLRQECQFQARRADKDDNIDGKSSAMHPSRRGVRHQVCIVVTFPSRKCQIWQSCERIFGIRRLDLLTFLQLGFWTDNQGTFIQRDIQSLGVIFLSHLEASWIDQ